MLMSRDKLHLDTNRMTSLNVVINDSTKDVVFLAVVWNESKQVSSLPVPHSLP